MTTVIGYIHKGLGGHSGMVVPIYIGFKDQHQVLKLCPKQTISQCRRLRLEQYGSGGE